MMQHFQIYLHNLRHQQPNIVLLKIEIFNMACAMELTHCQCLATCERNSAELWNTHVE